MTSMTNPTVTIAPGVEMPLVGFGTWEATGADALAALRAGGHSVRTILGEVELEKWPADVVKQFESVGQVLRPNTYLDLYDELTRSALFVGNDSGPGHIMAAAGCPVLSLFGPTTPLKAAPRATFGRSIRAQDFGGATMQHIPADAVDHAIDKMLAALQR